MTIRFFFSLVCIFLISKRAEGEPLLSVLSPEGQALLMGSFGQMDAGGKQNAKVFVAEGEINNTSPRRAFFSSILIPGLGQLLAGDTMRGVIFSGVELATLGMYLNWRGNLYCCRICCRFHNCCYHCYFYQLRCHY